MSVLAKAIYANVAESSDELEFKRGDIVEVLEQNTSGLEGWWLCSLHGRQGIAPGNRLRLLPITVDSDAYDIPQSQLIVKDKKVFESEEEYDIPRSLPPTNVDNIQPNNDVYDTPRAWFNKEDVYDIPSIQKSMIRKPSNISDDQEIYNIPNSQAASNFNDIYDIPPNMSRGSQPIKTVYVSQDGVEEVYDVPPTRVDHMSSKEMINVLDMQSIYDIPSTLRRMSNPQPSIDDVDVVYDVPQTNTLKSMSYGKSGLNSLRRMKREFSEGSQRKNQQSLKKINDDHNYVYDVPPQVNKQNTLMRKKTPQNDDDVVDGLLQDLAITNDVGSHGTDSKRLSIISRSSSTSMITDLMIEYNEIHLSYEDGLQKMITLKKNVEDSVSDLLTMVYEGWKNSLNIAENLDNIKNLFFNILSLVKDFVEFSDGCYCNTLGKKLLSNEDKAPLHVQEAFRKYILPLKEDFKMLQNALDELQLLQWNISTAVDEDDSSNPVKLDAIDSFVMSSRAVSDDVGQMAIFIHTHAQYIFSIDRSSTASRSDSLNSFSTNQSKDTKSLQDLQALQARPLPSVPDNNMNEDSTNNQEENEWLGDYDYVSFQSSAEVSPELDSVNSSDDSNFNLTTNLSKLNELKDYPNSPSKKFDLPQKSQRKILNLEIDVNQLMVDLSTSILKVYDSIALRNAPKDFVGLTKQVILSANKVVLISECVEEKIDMKLPKKSLVQHCEAMWATVRRLISSTKSAVHQWPSKIALQDVVDRLNDIATCAIQLKVLLYQII